MSDRHWYKNFSVCIKKKKSSSFLSVEEMFKHIQREAMTVHFIVLKLIDQYMLQI